MKTDLIPWLFIAAFAVYGALQGPKTAPYYRLVWLWFALSLTLLEVLDLRGGHPAWVKWPLVAVAVFLGSMSYVRNELRQRTRYAAAWRSMWHKRESSGGPS